MKRRIQVVVAALLLMVGAGETCRHFDSGFLSIVNMDYTVRLIRAKEESETMQGALEYWYLYEECFAESSFPQDMLAELAKAFQNDEVQEFVSSYEADYKILTKKEICAYVDIDPVIHKFYETEEAGIKECVWYQLRVEADKMAPDDLIVKSKTCSYMFLHGSERMEKGLPVGGGEIFVVNWEENNFMISPISYLGSERVVVYFCDGTLIGNEAVMTKMEDGGGEIRYYRYGIR